MATVHRGGCHCGAVRFEVDAPADVVVHECNCSVCTMTGFVHLIVAADSFRLKHGADALVQYTFNTHTARHLFCATCGVKSFYVPRSHPDGISVNARCLDGHPLAGVEPRPFDGQSWEKSARERGWR